MAHLNYDKRDVPHILEHAHFQRRISDFFTWNKAKVRYLNTDSTEYADTTEVLILLPLEYFGDIGVLGTIGVESLRHREVLNTHALLSPYNHGFESLKSYKSP